MAVSLSTPIRRAVIDGGIVAGLLFAVYLFVVVAPAAGTFGFDAYAYWAVDPTQPYAATAGALGAFTYSPAIALAFAPFGLLPFWGSTSGSGPRSSSARPSGWAAGRSARSSRSSPSRPSPSRSTTATSTS